MPLLPEGEKEIEVIFYDTPLMESENNPSDPKMIGSL